MIGSCQGFSNELSIYMTVQTMSYYQFQTVVGLHFRYYTLSEFSPENCIKGPLHSDNKSKNQNKINIDIAFLYKHFAYKQDYVRNGTKRKERNNSTSHINYLADQHRCFYDRDFEVDLYVFEAHDDCCYCDDDNGDDDKNY